MRFSKTAVSWLWLLGLLAVAEPTAFALAPRTGLVEEQPSAGSVPLWSDHESAVLWVDEADDPAVRRAAHSLQKDLKLATGAEPELRILGQPTPDRSIVLVGTIGRSPLLERLVSEGKIDASAIQGKWEAFLWQIIENPFPGVARALVIAGSDRRGTVYGIYTLSEESGVSPWHWWADVPVTKRAALHVRAGRFVDRGPVVKYRGIFLNDEAPALSSWAREKFGGFNHKFYERIFEVLLRLRANYLWPAMWGSAFYDDDPQNAALAHEFGIIMGTSHHEPLSRAHAEWRRYGRGSWNYATNAEALKEFWRSGLDRSRPFEQILTLGMRGDGDEPMTRDADVKLLETVVADQRRLISKAFGRPAADLPQVWALYKEVQAYYESGMRVPDDVTLLWADDNWGNIRRLPTPEERNRPGGAGVYYHFDYVGGPRNYKWINVTPIRKIWEQMHLAWQYGADRLWIVNVGDFKPMEFPTEFFLTYAWDPARWPYEKLDEYAEGWAARDFGSRHAAEIAALVQGYSKLNRRRVPEMLHPKTLSLVNYQEADRVVAEWNDLEQRAEQVRKELRPDQQDAFFQLVLYPVLASANIWKLHVAAGRNHLFATQGRTQANDEALNLLRYLQRDGELAENYHALGGGKWNHQMSQIKLGYSTWQEPNAEIAPPVHYVRPKPRAEAAIAIEGSERSWGPHNAVPPVLPTLDSLRGGSRWIEVFNRGSRPFSFTARSEQPWIKIQPTAGQVESFARLEVSVDWTAVPVSALEAEIVVATGTGPPLTVRLPLAHPPVPPPNGYTEVDRHVAMDAMHFTRSVERQGVAWRRLPGFGRLSGGLSPFPVTAPEVMPGGSSPRVEYDLELVSSGTLKVELHCAPSLDFQPGDGLRVGVSFDDEAPQIVRLDTNRDPRTWEQAVGESIRRIVTQHSLGNPGRHVFKLWYVTPGVVVERIVIDAGGVRQSYLGPPESPRGATADQETAHHQQPSYRTEN